MDNSGADGKREFLGRLQRGGLLPLVDIPKRWGLKDGSGRLASPDAIGPGSGRITPPLQEIGNLISLTGVEAVVAFRGAPLVLGALRMSDTAWMLKDGFLTTNAPRSRMVLSSSPSGAHDHGIEDAWMRIEQLQPLLWNLMVSYAARVPLLLLGCDPASGALQDLVARLRPHRHFEPAGWMVTQAVGAEVREAWSDLGIEIVELTDEAFMAEARIALAFPGPASRPTVWQEPKPLDRGHSGFKDLEYYTELDRAIFHGRDHDTERLVAAVTANRLVVVTGPSGTGKTSLLRAGLLATINAMPPYEGVYVRCMEDPVNAIVAGLELLTHTDLPRPKLGDHTSHDEMWRLLDADPVLPIIVIDQGEELFTRFGQAMRDSVTEILSHAVTDPRCRARFVIGIRDDYLAQFAQIRERLPSALQSCFYVGALTRENAITVFEKPFDAACISLEPGLAERVLTDVGISSVVAPQIQIVGGYLYRGCHGTQVTIEDYEAAGGTRGILGRFLKDQMAAFDESRAEAELVLKAMVTSEGTKDVLSIDEVAARAGLSCSSATAVMNRLVATSRLVRPVLSEDRPRYELTHEYLTLDIWQWFTNEERELRWVQEMIAMDLRTWRSIEDLRLGADRLDTYYMHASKIAVDDDIGTLLLLSSVRHLRPYHRWLEALSRLDSGPRTRVAEQLLDFVAAGPDDRRFEAAEAIASLDAGVVIDAIADNRPSVRNSALYMVGGLALAEALDAVVQVLTEEGEANGRRLACLALGEIGGAEAARVLRSQAEDPDEAIAAAAVRALGSCVTIEAFDIIGTALESPSVVLAEAAQRAVGAAKSRALLLHILQSAGTRQPPDSDYVLEQELTLNLLRGLDTAASGSDNLIEPLVPSIKAHSINSAPFKSGWLVTAVDGLWPTQSRERLTCSLGKTGLVTEAEVSEAVEATDAYAVSVALRELGVQALPVCRGLLMNGKWRAKLAVLMLLAYGLSADVEWRTYIRPSFIDSALRNANAAVRYWACLAVENLELDECVQLIRPLTLDTTEGESWRKDVGRRVCDAAGWALDRLRPESKVWRKDWQLALRELR